MTAKDLVNLTVNFSEQVEQFEKEKAQDFLEFLKKKSTTYGSVKQGIEICKRNAEWNNSEMQKRFLGVVENVLERELGSLPVTDCQES